MSVLIAGCGDLGTEAGLRYATAGHHVTAWRRNPAVLPHAFEGVAADLRHEAPRIPDDTEVLVIALAPGGAGGHDEAAYRATYVESTTRILDALDRDGLTPRRALFVSSTAVYGGLSGDVDEDSPAEPVAFNGRVMLEAEELFLRRLDATPTTPTVLRLGGIYGPGRSRLIDQVRAGEARPTTRRTSRIHRDDAAAAIVHLTTMAPSPATTYLGVDDCPATHAEVVGFLARELGAPAPPAPSEGGPRGADRACSNARMRATGWAPTFPTYAEGYRAILSGQGTRHP